MAAVEKDFERVKADLVQHVPKWQIVIGDIINKSHNTVAAAFRAKSNDNRIAPDTRLKALEAGKSLLAKVVDDLTIKYKKDV